MPATARTTAGKPATAETPEEETTATAGKPSTAKTPAIGENPATTDRYDSRCSRLKNYITYRTEYGSAATLDYYRTPKLAEISSNYPTVLERPPIVSLAHIVRTVLS